MGDIIGLSTGFGEAIRSAEKIDKQVDKIVYAAKEPGRGV